MLTLQALSGQIVYGPQLVSKTTSVKCVKELIFDPKRIYVLCWGDNVLKDSELLGDLDLPEEVTFLIVAQQRDTATATEAAAILGRVTRPAVQELLANRKPADIIRLVFHALFLALSVERGDDFARTEWSPFTGGEEEQSFLIDKVQIQVTGLQRLKDWRDVGSKMCKEVVKALRSVDHDVLQSNLRSGGVSAGELKRILDIECFTCRNSGKASGAALALHQWLEVSVKPFLCTDDPH